MNNLSSQNENESSSGSARNVTDFIKKGESKWTANFEKDRIENTLSNFMPSGPSYHYVYNVPANKFMYLSEGLQNLLGANPGTFTPSSYLEVIHPDDLGHVEHCKDLAEYFLTSHVDQLAVADYKVSYQFRIKDKFGKYKIMLHQSIPISLDDAGQPLNVLAIETDISHITTSNNYKMSFLGIGVKKSYFNIRSKEDLSNPRASAKTVTERELDVLRLLSEGYSSKEISKKLHIAYDTVRTHRNNILKKTKMKTLAQVISHYIKEGLI